MTFVLPGFRTIRRESIELTSGLTATINADLQLGTLEETVTVTGASPLVDTSNVREQSVLTRELIDTLPIIQGTDPVVIHYEMIHESRIVPLDGRPHLDPSVRQYLGDSRGRWEGDTLVIDTTNSRTGRTSGDRRQACT